MDRDRERIQHQIKTLTILLNTLSYLEQAEEELIGCEVSAFTTDALATIRNARVMVIQHADLVAGRQPG